MKKYRGIIWGEAYLDVEVEAENAKEAEEKIKHMINEDKNFTEEFCNNFHFDNLSLSAEGVREV